MRSAKDPIAWMVLAVGFSFLSAGQEAPPWRWSNPMPHGNNIVDMAFKDGLYVQVTDHGGIYTSTNRLVWEKRESGTVKALRGVAFFKDRLLITGEEGTALYSDDGVSFRAAAVVPSTLNWLEGVAASADIAVAVGDEGTIYRTVDGTNWSAILPPGFSAWLSGVAYGEGRFVAVGEGGFIGTSADGFTWQASNSGLQKYLTRVAYGDGRFLVVGDGGTILQSADGSQWLNGGHDSITNNLLVAALGPGQSLVAGESALWLRDGLPRWFNQLSGEVVPVPAPDWTYAAALWDGERWVVAGRTGVALEGVVTNVPPLNNVVLWPRLDESTRGWLWAADRIGGTYLAVGERATVLSSLSGDDWRQEIGQTNDSEVVYFGVGGSDTVALAVGTGGSILRSEATFEVVVVTNSVEVAGETHLVVTTNTVPLLGLEWEDVGQGLTQETLQGVGWDGREFIVTGEQGTLLRSPDGRTWTLGSLGTGAFVSSVARLGNQWIAVGVSGDPFNIFTSADAVTWIPVDSGTTNWVYRVRSWGEDAVAVGQGGLILVSTNGTEWTRRESGTTAFLTDVRRVGRAYYVCGTQATLLRSEDLVAWSPEEVPTGKSFYGMAADGGQLILAGAEGVILRRTVEPDAGPVAIADFRRLADAGVGIDLFLFQGTPEVRFRLEAAEPLGVWGVDGEFELDQEGGLLEGTTSRGPERYYRTAVGGTP